MSGPVDGRTAGLDAEGDRLLHVETNVFFEYPFYRRWAKDCGKLLGTFPDMRSRGALTRFTRRSIVAV